MALTRTLMDTEVDQRASGNTPEGVSTAFTPPNNSLLVVIAAIQGVNASPGALTCSGGGLTFTNRYTGTPSFLSNYYGRGACWTAPVSTGASMSVTVSDAAVTSGDSSHVILAIYAYEGYDTGSPVGATATNEAVADANLTMTLSGSPASDSDVIAFRARSDQSGVATNATPDASWTELHDLHSTSTGYIDLQTMARTGSTSTSVIWSDTSDDAGANSFVRNSFALEIKAAQDGGGAFFWGQQIF